jgi:hypothetical protein
VGFLLLNSAKQNTRETLAKQAGVSGDTTPPTFIRFNAISTKSKRDANHAEVMKSKSAKNFANHQIYSLSR